MPVKNEIPRFQVCRLPKPYTPYYSLEPKDKKAGLENLLITAATLKENHGVTAASIKRLKEGSSISIDSNSYVVVDVLRKPCRYLDEEKRVCSLPDPTKCPGCKVVEGADSLDSAINLDTAKLDLEELTRLKEAGLAVDQYLQFDDQLTAETCKIIDAFVEKYIPSNHMTKESLGYPIPSDIEIDDNPSIVWRISVDEETGEYIERTKVGVLKGTLENPYEISQDIVYLTALHANIVKALAQVGMLKSQAETNTKRTKAELHIQADSFIQRGVITTKDTKDNKDSLVRGSTHYKEAKDTEARAIRLYSYMWGYKGTIEGLINSLKATLSVLGSEKYYAQTADD